MADFMRWALGMMALLAVGCGVDAGETTTGGAGGTGTGGEGGSGPSCPEDPADGPVPPECGVWVSVSQGDDSADGTQAAPVATLNRALELAEKGLRRIYACKETWNETVVMPGNVSLHGGFDCAEGWKYLGGAESDRSTLLSQSATGLLYVDGEDPTPSFLTDFDVHAADAVLPGESSYGLFVRDQNMVLTIRRCTVFAGNGADGIDGESGAPDGETAAAGADGNNGADACSAPLSEGGIGPDNACDVATSRGGDGGDGGPVTATSGGTGEPIAEPPSGQGGLGEQLSPACTIGHPGAPGNEGAPGMGGFPSPAWLTEEGYIGPSGTPGAPGAPGQGGGGGGATFGSAATCGVAKPGGAAGGSGGAGGCGGKGGQGGKPGGASIGLAVRCYTGLSDIRAVAAKGGRGGNSGPPQEGGSGGAPGLGGAGLGAVKPACAGGPGGKGGRGGWGGGGSGGASIGFVRLFEMPGLDLRAGKYSFEFGEPGPGGQGDPDDFNTDGQIGNNADIVSAYGSL